MEKTPIKIVFIGHPEPQGSMSAYPINGKCIVTSANKKLKKYRRQLSAYVKELMGDDEIPWAGQHVPVELDLTFFLEKPKSTKRKYPSVKPDADKLGRSVLDALTGLIYVDDGQVVDVIAKKRYGTPERVEIIASIKS